MATKYKTVVYDDDAPITGPVKTAGDPLESLSLLSDTQATAAKLTQRPAIYLGKVTNPAPNPAMVERGAVLGFTMPIYNNDDQEIFCRDHVPGRWNGASDVELKIKCYIDTANTAGEKFQFQVSWSTLAFSGTNIVPSSTTDLKKETTIVTGTQYAPYEVNYTIDWNFVTPNVTAGDLLSFRIRRIAVEGGSDECEGNIVITDITVTYTVDKIYKPS